MQGTQAKAGDTGRRVQGFLDAQTAVTGTIVPAPLRAQLDGAVTQLTTYQVEQGTAAELARGETLRQIGARREVYTNLLRPIAHAARLALGRVPEVQTLTVSSLAAQRPEVVAKLGAVADAAAKYEKVFIAYGLPADFLAQLRAAATQITGSMEARARQLSRRAAATAGLKAGEKTVRDIVTMLDHVLTAALKSNPALLADWKASKKIPLVGITPSSSGSAAASTSAAALPAPATPTAPAPATRSTAAPQPSPAVAPPAKPAA